jgi:integrase
MASSLIFCRRFVVDGALAELHRSKHRDNIDVNKTHESLSHKILIGQEGYKRGMAKDYLHMGEYRTQRELELIKEQVANKANREKAIKYAEFLQINNRHPNTVARRCRELRTVLSFADGPLENFKKPDIEQLVLKINRLKKKKTIGNKGQAIVSDEDSAEITKAKTKLCLKDFFRWLRNAEEYPDEVRWIKVNTTGSSKKLPTEMLTEDDIMQLIKKSDNSRDSCLVSLLFETGMRAGEILRLKMRDVITSQQDISYVMVSPEGKTGARRTPFITALPYVITYINEYRRDARPDEPFFVDLFGRDRAMSYEYMARSLKVLAKRAKIHKPVNPHAFRHSSATRWANLLTESQMKAYLGWTQSSKMASVYVHLSGKNLDDAIRKANGQDVKPEQIKAIGELSELTQMKQELAMLKKESKLYRKAFDALGKSKLSKEVLEVLKESD